MRIDKYLKVARIIKRRTIANDACDAGRVTVNGTIVKASYNVAVGDKISIRFGSNTTELEVVSLKESVKKEEAGNMFKSL
jgi:ribosomal 50S subunit-recycling heat shock protein